MAGSGIFGIGEGNPNAGAQRALENQRSFDLSTEGRQLNQMRQNSQRDLLLAMNGVDSRAVQPVAAGINVPQKSGGNFGGGATFTPTASGLFANAAQPFSGQSVQQRMQGKQNLLGNTAGSAGGVAGSAKLPPHPFMS